MAFKDLSEFSDGRILSLPIDGVVYVVEDVDADTGIWAQQILELGHRAFLGEKVDGADLDDNQERSIYQRLLGDTFEQLAADGVKWDRIKHCAFTALVWICSGEAAAEKLWDSYGADPSGEAEAQPPNRASRRASAAAVRTTPKRASTSGTRASKSSAPARAGAKSSKPGS